jgi:ankyrin repeat protein
MDPLRLIQAILDNNFETAKSLLSQGTNLNIIDMYGNTLLRLATNNICILNHDLNLIKLLLSVANNGADPLIKDKTGKDAYYYAKESKESELQQEILNLIYCYQIQIKEPEFK